MLMNLDRCATALARRVASDASPCLMMRWMASKSTQCSALLRFTDLVTCRSRAGVGFGGSGVSVRRCWREECAFTTGSLHQAAVVEPCCRDWCLTSVLLRMWASTSVSRVRMASVGGMGNICSSRRMRTCRGRAKGR